MPTTKPIAVRCPCGEFLDFDDDELCPRCVLLMDSISIALEIAGEDGLLLNEICKQVGRRGSTIRAAVKRLIDLGYATINVSMGRRGTRICLVKPYPASE